MQFVTSAANLNGCPEDAVPEVALMGRSNAGKSSLINALSSSKIAKVSGTPGKTTLLNFFNVGGKYRIVDMPGYGFASRSASEVDSWQGMIEPFLAARGNLCGLLLLIDIRREWSQDERLLLNWLRPRDLPCAIVLTKADKLTRNEINKQVQKMRKVSGVEHVFVTSSLKKAGFAELEEFFFHEWVKPYLSQSSGDV